MSIDSLPVRRTIDELAARYQLEPSLRDVYVEGILDELVVSWFLDEQNLSECKVYPVDSVHVPDDIVNLHDLEVGARGRVIALGLELGQLLNGRSRDCAVFVADRDSEWASQPPKWNCDRCLLTDFTSMELYAFEVATIDKLLKLFFRTDRTSGEEVVQALTPALQELFLIRVALHRSGLGIGLGGKLTKWCDFRSGEVRIETDQLVVQTVINGGGTMEDVQHLKEAMTHLHESMPTEPRESIHGHDFVLFMSAFLRAKGLELKYVTTDMLSRLVYLCFDSNRLLRFSLFQELVDLAKA